MNYKSYRLKHRALVFIPVLIVIENLLPVGSLPQQLFKWLYLGLVLLFSGMTYEKKDELVRQYLAKANGIALTIVIIALFVLSIVGENTDSPIMRSDMYIDVALCTVSLRSLIYVIIDRPAKGEEEEDE